MDEFGPSFTLKYQFSTELNGEDIDYCLNEINGKIIATHIISGKEKEDLAGTFRLEIIDMDYVINNHYSIFDVFDLKQELLEYHAALYNGDGEIKEELIDRYGEELNLGGILIIHTLELLPGYRGNELGLKIIYRIINQFTQGISIIAIKPFPMQFNADRKETGKMDDWLSKINYNNFVGDEKKAFSKLRKYWGKLGFKRILKSEIFILNIKNRIPELDNFKI